MHTAVKTPDYEMLGASHSSDQTKSFRVRFTKINNLEFDNDDQAEELA